MKEIIYLSVVCATISFTITEMHVFEPLRNLLKTHNPFLGNLFSCGYCLGHWIAFGLVALVELTGTFPGSIRLFDTLVWTPLDYFFTALIIAWFSGIQWLLMCILMQRAKK